MPRDPQHIQQVVATIWEGDRVKCPVCAEPMNRLDRGYQWECTVGICPFASAEFNQGIHSYGVAENSPKDKRDGTVF